MRFRYINVKVAELDSETKEESIHKKKRTFGLIMYLKNK
jgi:hypothetical protein